MSSFTSSSFSAPIHDLAQLVEHFRGGSKPEAKHRIGLEHEKIAVLPDGRAPGHEIIARVIASFVARGWAPMDEAGALIGATHPTSGSFTLEPGGQLEHSGMPHRLLRDAVLDNDRHLDELILACASEGLRLVCTGFRPFFSVDEIPWMPKGRYVVMRDYLPRHGRRAHDMMKRTATVQANLDFSDEADAIEKLRLGQAISPLVTALFAASPLADGKPTGEQSYRASTWLETDPARCGLLPFLFRDGADFQGYADWALDVPMFFVSREGQYRSLAGEDFTFRRFIAEGRFGQQATMDDWELHLSTLFPELRLKTYIEVRQADASTREMVRALPALWRGVFASPDARRAAYALVQALSFEERVALQREVPRAGLRASPISGVNFLSCARELVAIASAGLSEAEPDALPYLDPLVEIVESGVSIADRILSQYTATGGDLQQLIPLLAMH